MPRLLGHPQLPFLDAVQEAAESNNTINKAVSNRFMYPVFRMMKVVFFDLIYQ